MAGGQRRDVHRVYFFVMNPERCGGGGWIDQGEKIFEGDFTGNFLGDFLFSPQIINGQPLMRDPLESLGYEVIHVIYTIL